MLQRESKTTQSVSLGFDIEEACPCKFHSPRFLPFVEVFGGIELISRFVDSGCRATFTSNEMGLPLRFREIYNMPMCKENERGFQRGGGHCSRRDDNENPYDETLIYFSV